ncbi:hypothetical protein DMENIID0001_107270 [Sergentomyia squamirostris]
MRRQRRKSTTWVRDRCQAVSGDKDSRISASGSQTDLSDKEGGSPKPNTWKGLVARHLRKYSGKVSEWTKELSNFSERSFNWSTAPSLCSCKIFKQFHVFTLFFYAASFQSEDNVYVPKLVVHCTEIIEQEGLDNVGIYRIPGKTAAIAALTKQVNRGFDEETMMDPKWKDLNVVCSLLKSFIRNLPEPLLPKEIYTAFISADKKSGRERYIPISV